MEGSATVTMLPSRMSIRELVAMTARASQRERERGGAVSVGDTDAYADMRFLLPLERQELR